MDNCECSQYQIKEDSFRKSDCIQNKFIDLNMKLYYVLYNYTLIIIFSFVYFSL